MRTAATAALFFGVLACDAHGVRVHAPSFFTSQKQVAAVCSPAPFFCMMMHVTDHAVSE